MMMQIEDMTVEQIERYLQERKARKGELGGVMKRVDELQPGETVWIKAKKEKEGATFRLSNCADGFSLYMSTLVETNVPERAPARRRMTAGEALDDNLLKQGDIIWIKAEVRDPGDGGAFQPCFSGLPEKFSPWLDLDQEIEVDA